MALADRREQTLDGHGADAGFRRNPADAETPIPELQDAL
jgi:hypothetical protein